MKASSLAKHISEALVVVLVGSFVFATGFASWAITGAGDATADARVAIDDTVINLSNAVSIKDSSFPKIGQYFFFTDGSNVRSETGILSYSIEFDPQEINPECIIGEGAGRHMDFYLNCSLSISNDPECFASNNVLSSASFGGSTIAGIYSGASFDFVLHAETSSMSKETKTLTFTFTNKLIYSHRDVALNKAFLLTITFGDFAS